MDIQTLGAAIAVMRGAGGGSSAINAIASARAAANEALNAAEAARTAVANMMTGTALHGTSLDIYVRDTQAAAVSASIANNELSLTVNE